MQIKVAFWLLLALVVGVAGVALDRTRLLAPARSAVLRALAPVQVAVTRAVEPASTLLGTRTEAGRLREENDRLRELVADLNATLVQMRELELENRRLREELGYKVEHPGSSFIPATIVGQDPSNLVKSITIDKGTDDGVKEGMVVVAPAGLVGRVTRVQSTSAEVLLIADSRSSIYAVLQRPDSRAAGVVQGQLRGPLILKYLPQGETVREGDVVVTSGRGLSFPRGLYVGRVTLVRQNDVEMFQEALVEPAVDFARLENVMVITNFLPKRLD